MNEKQDQNFPNGSSIGMNPVQFFWDLPNCDPEKIIHAIPVLDSKDVGDIPPYGNFSATAYKWSDLANPGKRSIQVRTRFFFPYSDKGYYTKIRAVQADGGKKILGPPKCTHVGFHDDWGTDKGSSWVTFELDHDQACPPDGVAVSWIKWHWEYQIEPEKGCGGTNWQRIGSTHHVVFAVLDIPQFPWTGNSIFRGANAMARMPWFMVMAQACDAAQGTKNKNEAAYRITHWLRNHSRLNYHTEPNFIGKINDPDDPESPKFQCLLSLDSASTIKYLKLGNFLSLWRTGVGKNDANCEDIAHLTVAFANILGCNLVAGNLQPHQNLDRNYSFEINPVKTLGESTRKYTEFDFHTVAWTGPDGEWKGDAEQFKNPDIRVFDFCFKISGPNSEPFELAADMPMGTCKPIEEENAGLGYRARLAKPGKDGCNLAIPQPNTVSRLMVI